MKTCFKCNQEKPLSEFYKHKHMADGHVNKCKECNKKDVRDNYNVNSEHYANYERKRSHLPHRMKLRGVSEKSNLMCQIPKSHKAYPSMSVQKSWVIKNPNKKKAYNKLSVERLAGRIKMQPCEVCGKTENIQAHHDDYDKPLDVRWLCVKHHNEHHRKVV